MLVSFGDLRFEDPPATAGNGGQGGVPGTGGEGGTVCEGGQLPATAGRDATFGGLLERHTVADAAVHAAAMGGEIVYVGGEVIATPVVARFDPSRGIGPQLVGNNPGEVTAVAGKQGGVFFAGKAKQILSFPSPCAESFQTGLFVAEWNTNNTCSLIHGFGMYTAPDGSMTAAVADGQAVIVAGHGTGPNLGCDSSTQFRHFIGRYGLECEWAQIMTLSRRNTEGIKAAANLGVGIVVAGRYDGAAVDLAGCELEPSIGVDAFVAILRSEHPGDCLLAKTFRGAGTQVATALAVDPLAREIYVAGRYTENLDFGGCTEPLPAAGLVDAAFVAKLKVEIETRSAQVAWARGFTASQGMDVGALAFFASDDVRLGGSFVGLANFSGTAFDNPTSFGRIFVTKLDAATGQHRLTAVAETFGPEMEDGHDLVRGMVATPAGEMVFAGSFQGDTTLLGMEPNMPAAYMIKTNMRP